jgi:hypothetical protein
MRPAINHFSISAVRADALFVSALQRSDEPSAAQVREAIAGAVRRFGGRGCAGQVAQEFGDHPDIAAARMRWARRVIAEAFGGPERQRARTRLPARHLVARASRAA